MNETRGPAWLRSSKRRVFFDMHLPSWPDKGVASRFDPPRLAASIAGAGADSTVIFAKCQYGNFYTRLSGEHLHPGLGETDLLVELSNELRSRGVRTLAYYSVSWDEHVADGHPEWLAVRADGTRAPGRWRTLCINGPYADVVERHLREIAAKPVDGIWLDMTIIGDGNCYCPRCRARWADTFGGPMPAAPGDDGFERVLSFRYRIVEELYERLRASVRAVAPDAAFTNNYWGYPWSSTGMGSRALGSTASADFVTGEAYSDWTGIRSTALLPVFLRGVAGGRPFESLIGTGVTTWDFTRKPRAFLAYEAYSLFAHGATVTVDDEPFHDGRYDESLYAGDLRDIFGDIAAAAETAEGRQIAFAAIYHSQRTKDAARGPDGFVRDVSGAFRMLHDLHLPTEFLFDESPA
ncbi:MAG TPA: hypothetical protein VHE79_16190, partial [Spirochaetia bacterium]